MVVGCGNGEVKLYYDPKKSLRSVAELEIPSMNGRDGAVVILTFRSRHVFVFMNHVVSFFSEVPSCVWSRRGEDTRNSKS